MNNRKKHKTTTFEKISGACDIPFDMMLAHPYIRMMSNREILVEDAGKLMHYDKSRVKIMQKKTCIDICGDNLKLICLANNGMRVVGYIKSVSFE